jgi:hypothetical protein
MKIPATGNQCPEQFTVIEQALGNEMHHRVLTLACNLQLAGHTE